MKRTLIRLAVPMLALLSLHLLPTFARADEPEAAPKPPMPWVTAARIRVEATKLVGLQRKTEFYSGSGTVVYSTPERSLILTCNHLFEAKNKVTVDLFHPDAERTPKGHLQLRFLETHPAKVLGRDPRCDVALVEFQPGRVLACSPIAPESFKLSPGMALTAVGCGEGKDATVWSTEVTELAQAIPGWTRCRSRPKQGRSGGGLFTPDGVLVGVCDFAEISEDYGQYASPETIRNVLLRAGLLQTMTGWPRTNCPPQGCPTSPSPQRPAQAEPGYRAPQWAAATPPPAMPPTPGKSAPDPPGTAQAAPAPAVASVASLSMSPKAILSEIEAALPEGSHMLAIGAGLVALFYRRRDTAVEAYRISPGRFTAAA
ncbi:MAG: Thioredoxin [Planctomycetota bacterium]|nr:Thioredoxin [Planctomycetota bacterium]